MKLTLDDAQKIKDFLENNYIFGWTGNVDNIAKDLSEIEIVGQIEPQVMQLLADRQVNIIELRHLLNKVKRVKIKEDVEQILINDLGETYDRIEDKNFINKYAGKITNIYEWCGDWWILEDDNYVITENCFEKLSK